MVLSLLSRVSRHPGLPVVIWMTVLGFAAGMEGGILKAIAGAAIMTLLAGLPVALTLPKKAAQRGEEE